MLNKIIDRLYNMEEDNSPVRVEEINELGFAVRRSSDSLAAYGIALAGLGIVDVDGLYVPVIMVDYDFIEELDRNTQMFLLYHEMGHYNLQKDYILNGYTEREIRLEYEADEYAAKMMGVENAIKALEAAKRAIDEISFGTNTLGMEEIDIRIENLVNKFTILN